MWFVLIAACTTQDDARFQRSKAGNPATDDGTPYVPDDSGETGADAEDSPPPEDTSPPDDTAPPDDSGGRGTTW